ncbi:MAG: hypothetical protein II240_07530 [Bacteroidaceae bacterium]|nr:hypothetical protein [Bacteroidaceae bacterium]
MNNINRGVLIGLRISLEQIAETLESMCINEENKESGTFGNVPIDYAGSNIEHLQQAIDSISQAVQAIREIVPQNADFEE